MNDENLIFSCPVKFFNSFILLVGSDANQQPAEKQLQSELNANPGSSNYVPGAVRERRRTQFKNSGRCFATFIMCCKNISIQLIFSGFINVEIWGRIGRNRTGLFWR